MNSDNTPWYGFDLDGTLASTEDWQGIDFIGKPITSIVERAKEHIAKGDKVKIFTARVARTGVFVEISQRYDDDEFANQQTQLIQDWCQEHIGVCLEVTAVKDFACVRIYDDRATQVIHNTGRLVEAEAQQITRDALAFILSQSEMDMAARITAFNALKKAYPDEIPGDNIDQWEFFMKQQFEETFRKMRWMVQKGE